MATQRIYELYLSLIFKIIVFGMLGLMIAIGVLFIITDLYLISDAGSPGWHFGLLIILIAVMNFYWIFTFPHRIIVLDTDEIIFKGLLRQRRTFIKDIESIKADPSQFFGFLVIKTKHEKIMIMNQFNGFHDFVANLKAKKPSIELRGC